MNGVKISILNLEPRAKGGDISITTSGISLTQEVAEVLKAKKGDFLFVGAIGKDVYIAKRPSNMFGGHQLGVQPNSNRMYIQIHPDKLGITKGNYTIVPTPIPQEQRTVHDTAVQVIFYAIKPA